MSPDQGRRSIEIKAISSLKVRPLNQLHPEGKLAHSRRHPPCQGRRRRFLTQGSGLVGSQVYLQRCQLRLGLRDSAPSGIAIKVVPWFWILLVPCVLSLRRFNPSHSQAAARRPPCCEDEVRRPWWIMHRSRAGRCRRAVLAHPDSRLHASPLSKTIAFAELLS